MKYIKRFNESEENTSESNIIPFRGRNDILNSNLKEIKTSIDTDGSNIIHLIFDDGVLLIFGDNIESSIVSKEYYDRNYK